MKKKVLILLLAAILVVGCGKKEEQPVEDKKVEEFMLMERDEYKNLKVEEISNIEVIWYTVAGDQRETIEEYDEIVKTFNMLKSIKLGEKTEMVCEDNTKVYVLNTKDGNKYKIEVECDWVIIGKDRYLIVK